MTENAEIDEKTAAVLKRKGYKILSRLSSGAFGQVYKAQKEGSDDFVAVKVMNLEKVSDKFKQKFLPRELAALIEVNHENVIQTYDIFRSNRKIYIFMEFAGNGDIAGYIKKHGAMKEPLACVWFTQICDALNYLHTEVHMAHRDIKIDNILLNEQNIAKLTDFGFAKEAYDPIRKRVILSETFCGTEPYYSPQILQRRSYDPFMADVWAMGVVLFAMVNNKFPFHFGDRKAMLKEQTDPNHLINRYTRKLSHDLKNLEERMFDPKENTRITFSDVLRHAWVRNKGRY